MSSLVSKQSLLAVLAALATAFALTFGSFASAAWAQNPEPEKHAWCHATGSATNPFVLVVVQEGGPRDVAHEGHADDIDLGETTAQSPAEFRELEPDLAAKCGAAPTVSPSPKPTVSPSPKPTVSPSPKPTVSPSPSPKASPSPSPSPKASPSPSPSPKASPSPSPSPKASPTATATASPTATASATAAASAQYTLPPTGGGAVPTGALALGAGALLLIGGLVARRIIR